VNGGHHIGIGTVFSGPPFANLAVQGGTDKKAATRPPREEQPARRAERPATDELDALLREIEALRKDFKVLRQSWTGYRSLTVTSTGWDVARLPGV
jgi:hypothetical protein